MTREHTEVQRIEYPKLKKIGGLSNFAKNNLLKILVILLGAVLLGYLGGHTVQKSFRNITGYNQPQTKITEEVEKTATEIPDYEGDSAFMGVTTKAMQVIDTGIIKATNAMKESELVQGANQFSLAIIYGVLNPILRILDWAAFWFSFILCFMLGGWLAGKLINFEKQVVYNGVDPTIIKNMNILEVKVKELVDNANQKDKS